jgi:hypothetical protein
MPVALMMQSRGTYALVGTAASYFATKKYETVTGTSQYTYRAIIYTNR